MEYGLSAHEVRPGAFHGYHVFRIEPAFPAGIDEQQGSVAAILRELVIRGKRMAEFCHVSRVTDAAGTYSGYAQRFFGGDGPDKA